MQAYGGEHCLVECPGYNTARVKQLEKFAQYGLDSLAVPEAIATISRDQDQCFIVNYLRQANIVLELN